MVASAFTPGSHGGYRHGVGTLRANGGDLGGGSESLVAHTLTCKHEGLDDGTGRGTTIVPWPAQVAPTLNAHFGEKQVLEDQHALGGAGLFVGEPMGLNARQDADAGTQAVAFDKFNQSTSDVYHTIRVSQDSGDCILSRMAVRRLTPTECERLQGFPDGWTNVSWRGKPEAPDGPRYKALGNSMAVNVMRWIGDRIDEVQP